MAKEGLPGFVVTERVEQAHPTVRNYPLLPDDLLFRETDGTYTKECPGVAVVGFTLTPDQEATLKPVSFINYGLTYVIEEVDT